MALAGGETAELFEIDGATHVDLYDVDQYVSQAGGQAYRLLHQEPGRIAPSTTSRVRPCPRPRLGHGRARAYGVFTSTGPSATTVPVSTDGSSDGARLPSGRTSNVCTFDVTVAVRTSAA